MYKNDKKGCNSSANVVMEWEFSFFPFRRFIQPFYYFIIAHLDHEP